MRIVSVGHGLFAAVLIAIGIIGLVHSGYAAIWNGVPKGFPAREALSYLCALVALGSGLGLLARRTAAPAIRVWLVFYLLWTVIFKGRFILFHPLVEGSYQSTGENAVILAGSWVLLTWFATDWDKRRIAFATGERGLRIGRVLFGLALIAFGLSHFVYLNLTAPLVPAWLPGPVAWAYFTGIAYLVAGAAVLAGVYARLAAALTTLQMGLFLLLIWIPRAVTGRLSEFQWGELVATCALVAAAWVVAESYRDRPWLALRKR